MSTENEDDKNDLPEITHSVVFKCISAHKEIEHQEILALANRNLKNGKSACKAKAREFV